MHGDRNFFAGTTRCAAGPGAGSRLSKVLTTRFFASSPQSLIPLVASALYPILGGSPELWLPLILAGLLGCLYLTMLEFTGLLIAVNLVYVGGRWWLPDAGVGIDMAAGLLMANVLLLYGRYAVFRRLNLLSEANLELAELAMVDTLTGAYNRHYLSEEGDRIYHGFRRGGGCFSLILADIDDFKEINDVHGHAGGDVALMWFADLLNKVLRTQDVAGRYGGDEFLIMLPGTHLDDARHTAKRLQRIIAQRDGGAPVPCQGLRVSMGLAQVEITDNRFSDVVEHADAALYQAKREGRDTIRLWQSGTGVPAAREVCITGKNRNAV